LTVEEFERIAPLLDGPSELVDGKLRLMSPTNFRHGILSNRLGHIITSFLEEHLEVGGDVVGAETGFRIDDPRRPVQAPDVGYVRAGRAPDETGDEDSLDHFMDGPPDLAVEVRSPSERASALRAKADRWLTAGTNTVWIVDGRRETVQVLRPGTAPITLTRDETLTAPEVLPGFAVPVARLFARR
jgi:Uma2 family endonuclease